jgi:DNA polymerase (family 10)
VTNQQISAMFRELADLLIKKKESWFKVRAYRKVADEIDKLTMSLSDMAAQNRLREIPGVGDAIEKKLVEMLTTGSLQTLERTRKEMTEGGVGQSGK